MARQTSPPQAPTFLTAQQCNSFVHFLALEMYVSSHQSAMKRNLSVFMTQQLCGHQMWLKAVFVYVCWSRVLVRMGPLSWTGLRFEAHPLECWTAPPSSVHSPVVQNVQESTLHRYFDSCQIWITRLKKTVINKNFLLLLCSAFLLSRKYSLHHFKLPATGHKTPWISG